MDLGNNYSSGQEIVLQVNFSSWCHLTSMPCFSFADCGEVYTWGWKECIPTGKVFGEPSTGVSPEKDVPGRQSSFLTEQGMFDLLKVDILSSQLPVLPREWSKLAKVYKKEWGRQGTATM